MKLKFLLSSAMLLAGSLGSFAQMPTYCQPSGALSNGNWAKAMTQSIQRIIVENVNDQSAPVELINYETKEVPDNGNADSYSYDLHPKDHKFTVRPGDKLAITVKSGIWTADQFIFLDFDRDGDFEEQYAAFGDISQPMSADNSSWSKSKYHDTWAEASYRKEIEKSAPKNEILTHTFEVTVPENANPGECVLRVVSDGDGSGWHAVTPCGKVGWAGNMIDLGMVIEGPTYINEVVKTEVKVGPNPAHNLIYVNLPKDVVAKVTVYNLGGATMYTGTIQTEGTINVAGWAAGTYIVKVLDKSYKVVVK